MEKAQVQDEQSGSGENNALRVTIKHRIPPNGQEPIIEVKWDAGEHWSGWKGTGDWKTFLNSIGRRSARTMLAYLENDAYRGQEAQQLASDALNKQEIGDAFVAVVEHAISEVKSYGDRQGTLTAITVVLEFHPPPCARSKEKEAITPPAGGEDLTRAELDEIRRKMQSE